MSETDDEAGPREPPEWAAFDDGASLGAEGSDGGAIVRDDEHPWGARITLERGAVFAPYAITCAVYGWMVHTRGFPTLDAAEREFAAMRDALGGILRDAGDAGDGVERAIDRFLVRFP